MEKELNIEDLLKRPPVEIDLNEISQFLLNKRILITGAAGSIGSELVRQIAKFNPATIIFFDHNENNQFFLEKEMRSNYPNIELIPRIGSVSDRDRSKAIFDETKPDIVYHVAANKHVPLCESNVSEAIKNNILGSRIIADMAAYANCEAFVFVSTDKAVNPTSVMGATKRIAECYTQIMSKKHPNTRFVTVRFGNVLGSSGSVVPIFKSQIESGGPITITHPDMYRYFMTIPEASKLLLQASVFGKTGSILILEMGDPVKILDLARNMIHAYGLKENADIQFKFTGIRPGEKIYEELLFDKETTEETKHPKIRNTKTPFPEENFLHKILILENLKADIDINLLKKEMNFLIPEANLSFKNY